MEEHDPAGRTNRTPESSGEPYGAEARAWCKNPSEVARWR
jgi:hypothetical protein